MFKKKKITCGKFVTTEKLHEIGQSFNITSCGRKVDQLEGL